jgi:hypothetical protein
MMRATKFTITAAIAVAVAVVGVVVSLAVASPDGDRAWVEQFPAFEQLPQDDWQLVEDDVFSDYFMVRLFGWSETTARREAVYLVDRDVDQVASHIDERLGLEATHTRVEQYGASWVARRGQVSGTVTYQARASDEDRNRSVSVDVRPDTSNGQTRVTIRAGVSLR